MSSFTDSLQAQIDNLKAENKALQQRLTATRGIYEGLKASNELDIKELKALREQGGELLGACEEAVELISQSLEYDGEPVRGNNYKFLIQAISNATGLKKEGG